MNIQVGEYIRMDTGITKCLKQIGLYSYEFDNGRILGARDLELEDIKHSFNIIDLIEERRLCKWV